MSAPLKVYVAGPFTQGDQFLNVAQAKDAAAEILLAGHHPFVPHLYVYIHERCPFLYEAWMDFDLSWLQACDCVVRLPGESPGADREVGRAIVLGMPVYFGLPAFMAVNGGASWAHTKR